MTDETISVAEAAELLMATRENVRRMVWSGRLAGTPVEGQPGDFRIAKRAVERLIAEGGYVPGVTQPSE